MCDPIPGELPPKLALALAAQAEGNQRPAGRWFQLVSAAGPSCVSAACGPARARLADDRKLRIMFVDLASNIRPGTFS